MASEATRVLNNVTELEGELARLRKELDQQKIKYEKDIGQLQSENIKIKAELDETNIKLKEQSRIASSAAGGDKQKWEEQKLQFLSDMETERQHHQRLVKEHYCLLQKFENMQGDMQMQNDKLKRECTTLMESIAKTTNFNKGSKTKAKGKVFLAARIEAELKREETKSVENVAHIKHRERNYMGMLEYKREDEGQLIEVLIQDLKPKVASTFLPGLPAYLLFMCVRHTDYINDDEKVRTFLTSSINGIKKVVKKHHDDIERVSLWLANTCRFLHTLKQYSGEKAFQTENTPRQNEHSLRNFDLAEYRQLFSDLAVWIYQTLIKRMEDIIQPSIVSAVLSHEGIAGLTGSKPIGLRGRSSSTAEETPEHSLGALMKSMNMFVRVLTQHAVDPELTKEIFRQLYYFLGASALNHLLLTKDICNWSKGIQIENNLSHLKQWLRDNKLQDSGAGNMLEPIVQASQLLKASKTDDDVDSICELGSKLTEAQIVKILNEYTPVDEYEERVPISFIHKIQQKLKERDPTATNNCLMMDIDFLYPVTLPFNPSKIALESIDIPEQLHLKHLLNKL